MKIVQPEVSDYDNFVAFCMAELKRHPADEALRYFDNRFYNRRYSNQTGHLRQAFYAGKEFFSRSPKATRIPENLIENGRLATDQWPFLRQWRDFVQHWRQVRLPEGGDMYTVRHILPVPLGGIVKEGGGAGPSFKVVLPLVAKYLRTVGTERTFVPIGADRWDDEYEVAQLTRRTHFVTSRIIRDSQKSSQLKEIYQNHCQVCEERIEIRRNYFYSEVHHIQPLGGKHRGPDLKPNMLNLCPWHHVEFDHFLFRINPRSFALEHRLRKLENTELKLSFRVSHHLGSSFIEYNNAFFQKLSGA